MSVKLFEIALFLCVAIAFSSCSYKNEPGLKSYESAPILSVEQDGYRFAMYPDYLDESNSLIKLGIRDADNKFASGATVSAKLKAPDGHFSQVDFIEDPQIERYVAKVVLKHHEDYSAETAILLKGNKFSPRFIFHCGDPVPGVYKAGSAEQ